MRKLGRRIAELVFVFDASIYPGFRVRTRNTITIRTYNIARVLTSGECRLPLCSLRS